MDAWAIGKAIYAVAHRRTRANQTTYRDPMQYLLSNICFGPSDCWYWVGCLDSGGYGVWKYKRTDKAHRQVYRLWKKFIPHAKSILHTCDARNCVNPEHLYSGTQTDNMRDMVLRGRGRNKHTKEMTNEN